MRTIYWDYDKQGLCVIDQRRLPAALEVVTLHTPLQVAEAIRTMTVRGAPVIGVAAAFGLVLAAFESPAESSTALLEDLEDAAKILLAARPTAVNLSWALKRELQKIRDGRE